MPIADASSFQSQCNSRAWWQGSGAALTATDTNAVLGALADGLPFPLEPAQKEAWKFQIQHLEELARHLPDAAFFLEFAIPRMGRRADAVIVAGGLVFVLEYKVGATEFARHAVEQVHGYALDLKSFHETSHSRRIVPILVATAARPQPISLGFAEDGVASPVCLAAGDVLPAIRQMLAVGGDSSFDAEVWAAGGYPPLRRLSKRRKRCSAGTMWLRSPARKQGLKISLGRLLLSPQSSPKLIPAERRLWCS